MKSLLSFSKRCLDALLWSLGLSSVVLVLMLGFYICWTKPLSKTVNVEIAEKSVKEQTVSSAQKVSLPAIDKHSVYAGL
ncbi:hypothetical protein [Dyadobacter frigoris]|uniref:Uncharacterized protein n=1 Tax=Dyadobacter frigoris TaxID=2576211 RepID=A0A4U6D842_9BACT|nr:hypothetical protein [Dyadobacter frigoris]TKT92407.1 hypothetical protein FDK13_10555 [Dyadobacter frigoris]GLU53596.1 hypothetical protein Dfri01_30570 [Dyadobacter frigoris]